MSNTSTIERTPIIFKHQIPIADVPGLLFKQAIKDKEVKCRINGIRVNNPNTQRINVDVSFKILDDLKMHNPGTSLCGNVNSLPQRTEKIMNVKGKNVTLKFKANKTNEKGVLEINNTHELYTIAEIVLKTKGIMDYNEYGSIKTTYYYLDKFLRGGIVYLTSQEVLTQRPYGALEIEVNAVRGETKKEY